LQLNFLTMMQSFDNKVILITGGTSGIGLATAEAFVQAGARVIITGRNRGNLDKAGERLGVLGLVSDAGDIEDVRALPAQVRQHVDRIDVLFVNAGYGKFASLEGAAEGSGSMGSVPGTSKPISSTIPG
jgi:NAD(P)-dependent dehydrogenase (short-subunit alcohol dehydrogenase family)